ncbi:MAG: Ppx/GppA family phosphatase [Robiginitomaculum sp.]|nr:Ppx/GppA family phosphatase [Robiginitomaculum sp.]
MSEECASDSGDTEELSISQSDTVMGEGLRAVHKEPANRPRRKRRKPQHFAAIDLGTNNCRLLIARSTPGKAKDGTNNSFKVIDSFSRVVRLGAGLASTGRLSEKSMDMAVEAIGICADKMRAKSVKRWRCIATQACRAADNGDEFLARVKKETGLRFETISPRVESRLAVIGVLNIIDTSKDVALVIDIGGGSTELSWVDARRLRTDNNKNRLHRPPISAWVSLPIGVVNLSEMYPEDHRDRAGWYAAMKAHVLDEIQKQNKDKQFTNMFKDGKGHIVGTSGTVTSLAAVMMDLPNYQRDKIDGIWVDGPALIETARSLSAMPFAERQQTPCVGDDRATMITAGCAILDVVYGLWPSPKVRVADRGLREGMLMGLMQKPNNGGTYGKK